MHGRTHQSKHKKNTSSSKELHYRQDNEKYAVINCDKGNARFEVTIYGTNEISMAKARGSIISGPKRERLAKGDMVLLQHDGSTTSGDKYYILIKYSPDEVKRLRKAGELNEVKEANEIDKVLIAFENDVITKKQEELVIDDDFIAKL